MFGNDLFINRLFSIFSALFKSSDFIVVDTENYKYY